MGVTGVDSLALAAANERVRHCYPGQGGMLTGRLRYDRRALDGGNVVCLKEQRGVLERTVPTTTCISCALRRRQSE